MIRVVGTDPGTSSLDLLLLEDGAVAGQHRFTPGELRAHPEALSDVLAAWTPIDLIAGPSGYGLPLVRSEDFTEDHLDQMSLIRPNERGQSTGVEGFRSWVRSLILTGLPVIFLPGGIHLPTIPAHRKVSAVDMGTADKVAVAALALWFDSREGTRYDDATFAVVEIGTVFTSVMVVQSGRIVDAAAGSRGPIGLRSGGVWDGEVAYWKSPLSKQSLFRGGLDDLGLVGPAAFRESLTRHVAGLKAVTRFDRIYLSGQGLERSVVASLAREALDAVGRLMPLPSLPDAWVKHAAQGSALIADALAGGQFAPVADSLELRSARGTIWDAL